MSRRLVLRDTLVMREESEMDRELRGNDHRNWNLAIIKGIHVKGSMNTHTNLIGIGLAFSFFQVRKLSQEPICWLLP